MSIPDDLHYSKDHEWIRVEGEEAIVGITDFAQSELGDIIFIEFPKVGGKFSTGDTFGTVEAVKTVADLFMPVSGEILEVNSALDEVPEAVNEDPYETGWLVKIKMTASAEMDDLMDPEGYKDAEENEMLSAMGVGSFEDLIAIIPEQLRLRDGLGLEDGVSEFEVAAELSRLAALNRPAGTGVSFMGGGVYDHYIPEAIKAIAMRSEFYTAYTPYQAEVSQGTLQAMYEFQTMKSPAWMSPTHPSMMARPPRPRRLPWLSLLPANAGFLSPKRSTRPRARSCRPICKTATRSW